MYIGEEENNWKPQLKKTVYKNNIFIDKRGRGSWVIGDLQSDTQFMLPAAQKKAFDKVCELLDGKHSIDKIADESGIHKREIEKITHILQKKNMLTGKEGSNKYNFNEVDNLSFKLVNYQFKEIKKQQKAKKIVSTLTKFIHAVLILSICFFLFLNIQNGFAVFKDTKLQEWLSFGNGEFSYWKGYLLINTGMIFMFLFHETGHIIEGIHCGIQPEKFSFVLYLGFIPMFYVKNKNMYSLRKADILKVLFAGVYMNILLALVSINIYIVSGSEICKIMALSNVRIFLINLWPLSLSDGYFIFAVLFRRPNLRYKLHQFLAKPSMLIKYDKVEIIYTVSSFMVLIGTMCIEMYWLLSLCKISSEYRIGIFMLFVILYLLFLHFLEKRKFSRNVCTEFN